MPLRIQYNVNQLRFQRKLLVKIPISYNVNQLRVQRKLLFKIPISYFPPKDRKAFSENTEGKKRERKSNSPKLKKQQSLKN